MIGKIHTHDKKTIFACCDKELLNTTIEFNGVSIHISNHFYGGKDISIDEIIKNIEECSTVNIFGNNICNVLLEKSIITKEQIMYVDDVAHVQIYKI